MNALSSAAGLLVALSATTESNPLTFHDRMDRGCCFGSSFAFLALGWKKECIEALKEYPKECRILLKDWPLLQSDR